MTRWFLTLLAPLILLRLAFQGGIAMAPPTQIAVGDSAIYDYAVRYSAIPSQLLPLYLVILLATAGVLLYWLVRGRGWRLYGIALMLVVLSGMGIGWWSTLWGGGWGHVATTDFQGDRYQLAVWRGNSPGGWEVWRCTGRSARCTVIQAISVADLDVTNRWAASTPARFEVGPRDELEVVVEERNRILVEVP